MQRVLSLFGLANCLGGLVVAMAVCCPSVAHAGGHGWHVLFCECTMGDYLACCDPTTTSHTHIEQDGPLKEVAGMFDPDKHMKEQFFMACGNGTNCKIKYPAGICKVGQEVSVAKKFSVALGEGSSSTVVIEASTQAKDEVGSKIGWSPSWNQQQDLTIDTTETITSVGEFANPECVDVPPGKVVLFKLVVKGKEASYTFEKRKEHYCEASGLIEMVWPDHIMAEQVGSVCTWQCYYSGHNDLLGSGSSSGLKASSATMWYMGVKDPP